MPEVNKTELYKNNVQATLFGGFTDSEGRYGIGTILHILLLPVSLTVGAGVKTLIDVNTRYPFSEEKLHQALKAIDSWSDKELDMQIDKLILVEDRVKSNSSKKLIMSLKSYEKKFQENSGLDDAMERAGIKRDLQRRAIKSYLIDEKNAGKFLHNLIEEESRRCEPKRP